MGQPLFNRQHMFRNRARWEKAFAGASRLFEESADALIERLSFVKRPFQNILEVGRRGNYLGKALLQSDPSRRMTEAEFDGAEVMRATPGGFDLAISNLTLHGINDVPGALIQIRHALKPDGFFLASLLGGETLHELRECLYEAEMDIRSGISPRVGPFMDIRDAGALLQRAGFALPVAERETLTFIYKDAFALMNELRAMGEANAVSARERRFAPKALFARAAAIYRQRHAFEDGIKATFEIITLAGWTPHESQQKPLKPGEANFSLSRALNAEETATDDPARPRNAIHKKD